MAISNSSASAIASFGRVLLKALDERDAPTKSHCDRVIERTAKFGRLLGLAGVELDRLQLCGLFHDIGKIGIPDLVLLKPGPFDEREWSEMRSHAERGQRIVEAIDLDGVDKIALGVRHHHENFDGSGYPDGLAGEDIPMEARIVAIVDAYDAMAMPRPYHQAKNHRDIMNIMCTEAGHKYDPVLMNCFERLFTYGCGKAPDA